MDILQNLADTVESTTEEVFDTPGQFDLERENINGVFSNLTLLSMLLASLTKGSKLFRSKTRFKNEYDYIIVGGGSAGSVMASRLSEKPCVSVLLLEAGGEQPILTQVPSFARIFYGSHIDWAYKSTPQKYAAFGQKENKVILNSGKTLGGSSSINAMLYVRGNRKNYDDWEAEGATGWSYKDVLPYFLKLEDNKNIEELDKEYHSAGGLMTAEKINYIPEIKYPILEATKSMGYEQVDINGRRQTGVFDVQATVRNQQRCSTNKAYLDPARERGNLDILTYAFARKIMIDQSETREESTAYGVEFDYRGDTYIVRARKEVIICSGAIRTPQILMLSGIGPKEQLRKFNISVVADLPVGQNLQDHYSSHLIYTMSETITPVVLKNLNPINIRNYLINRKGPLAAPTQLTLLTFLDGLKTTATSTDFPKQEIYFAEYTMTNAKQILNLKDELFRKVYAPYYLRPLYICYPSLLQPYSRGEITLSSTDPYDAPNVNPNYYQDERDLKVVIEGMKICNAIAKHPAMRKVQAELIATQKSGYPSCEQYEGDEDEYFGCIAKQVVNTIWHYSGTARMGRRGDPRSVVDPQLRVIGVRNLRVVNAAAMPILPSANINVPTIMMAEKAYDMMKDDITCEGNQQVTENDIYR